MAEKKKSTPQSKKLASLAKSAQAVAETVAALESAQAPTPMAATRAGSPLVPLNDAPEAETPVKAKPKALAPSPAAPPSAPRVDIVTFWRMQHAAAEMRAAKAEVERQKVLRLYILALLDAKNRVLDVEKKQDEAKKKAEARENEFLSFKRILESQIGGRSLSDAQIHPESGEVHFTK